MVDHPMGWSMKAADRVMLVGEVYWPVVVEVVAAEGTRMVATTADMAEEEEWEGFQVRR